MFTICFCHRPSRRSRNPPDSALSPEKHGVFWQTLSTHPERSAGLENGARIMYGTGMETIRDESHLAEVCRQVLSGWPEARAAVLYGSRARGTHRTDSDWDVAFMLEGDEAFRPVHTGRVGEDMDDATSPLFGFRNLDPWTVGREFIKDNAERLGTLMHSVARDGVPVAGRWRKPDMAKEKIMMHGDDWLVQMQQINSVLGNLFTQLRYVMNKGTWLNARPNCKSFTKATADASEFLVKSTMARRGVAFDTTHSINDLAEAFEAERPGKGVLAGKLKALNGETRKDHRAEYFDMDVDVEGCERAVNRFTLFLDVLADELGIRDDAMKDMVPVIVEDISEQFDEWMMSMMTPLREKPEETSMARHMGSAIADGQSDMCAAMLGFGERLGFDVSDYRKDFIGKKGVKPVQRS